MQKHSVKNLLSNKEIEKEKEKQQLSELWDWKNN